MENSNREYIYKCPKCEGYNVSLDIETGKVTCNVCKPEEQLPIKRIDAEEYRMKSVAKEEEEFVKLQQQGTQISIDVKKDKISDENYNLLNKD